MKKNKGERQTFMVNCLVFQWC